MAQEFLLGIDIGTQSARAALLNFGGQIVASASTPLGLHNPQPGYAEQDPQEWWDATVSNIRQALARADISSRQVVGIGVCGQMHGTVPIDAHGRLLSHGVQLWCDKRSADLVEQFKARPETADAYRFAGNPPVANWVGFKIKWIQTYQPEMYQQTWKFILPKDFINYRLTGAIATDYSEASGSFLMDASTKAWSPELADLVGVDLSKLPDIYPAHAVIGHVTPEAAALTGLAADAPVVTGGGDMLCLLLAAGTTRPGRASDVTGTASHISVFTDAPVLDSRLMNLHHVIPGWIPFGIIDSGGGSLKWFKDALCQSDMAEARRMGRDVYDILDELADEVAPGSHGVLFFPYLMGERTLGTPHARGGFFGITPSTSKGMLVRAIMEGVTFELRRTLEIVENAGHTVEAIYHIGGGARSVLWSQIKADIYHKEVATFANCEGGLLGSAILAGVGAGIYENAACAAEVCQCIDRRFAPRSEWAERYDRLFVLFKEMHDALQGPYNHLAQIV